MARNYINRKRVSWKKVVSLVLGVLIIVGVVAGGAMIFSSDTRSISPTAFSVGGLDESGEYVAQENTIFTEDLIECQGLEITPDVKSTCTYKVYLYDHNKELIEVTEALAGTYKLKNTAVQYCRIMITPENSGEEDYTIGFFEVYSIANQLEITVNRKQNFEVHNYFEADKADKVAAYDTETNLLVYVAKEGYGVSKLANVEDIEELAVTFESAQPKALEVLFFTETVGEEEVTYEYVSTVTTGTDSTETTVTVPEGATHMVVNYQLNEDFVINAR